MGEPLAPGNDPLSDPYRSTSNPTVSREEFPETNKSFVYVVIALLVLILFAGGYVVYERYFSSDNGVDVIEVDNTSSNIGSEEEGGIAEEDEEVEAEEEYELESEADENIPICMNVIEGFSIQYPKGVEFDENCDYRLLANSNVEDIEVVDVITDFRKNWLFDVSRTETDLTALEFAQEEIGVLAAGGGVAEEGILPGSYQFVNDISHYSSISTYYPVGSYMYILEINARNPDVSPEGDIQQLYNSIVATFKILD